MRVNLRLDGRCLRRFHADLARRLTAICDLAVEIGEGEAPPLPSGIELLFSVEALAFGLPPRQSSGLATSEALSRWQAEGSPALTIDLCGGAPAAAGRTWQLTFDGGLGDVSLLGALAQGRAPLAALREGGRIIAAGRLGTESPGLLLPAFEDALIRTITLVVAAAGGNRGGTELAAEFDAAAPGNARLALRTGRTLARAAARRLYKLRYNAPHWRIGWRRLAGPDLIDLKQHPASGWADLPDDGSRFYADPFPILHKGVVTLFVEDFIHSLGKGIISAVAFGPDGALGVPEPVLELPVHLSYPFVFAREGEVWMVPESCAAGTIELFRATNFPGGWVKEATLVSGVVASDATLLEHDGRWWLFATVKADGGSFSDALHLWSAENFRGPWTPHRRNPVLIDIASARPAGRVVLRDGVLWRPVQDCRQGYGAALALARITQLDDEGFAQQVETILTAGPLWPGRRLHTLNQAGGFEFIDGSGTARKRWF